MTAAATAATLIVVAGKARGRLSGMEKVSQCWSHLILCRTSLDGVFTYYIGPVALAILNNGGKVDTLPLSAKAFPLPAVPKGGFPCTHFRYGVGGAVQNGKIPLACGGYDYNAKGPFSTCYRYNPKTHSWVVSGEMSEAKYHHASSLHPELGLIITGGYTNKRVRTVESTNDGKHFSKALPALPVEVHAHGQVTVDTNTVMVFGGCPPDTCFSNMAFKLNIRQKKWKRLPNLPTGRHAPSCAVVKENGVSRRVIVAGGNRGGTDRLRQREAGR